MSRQKLCPGRGCVEAEAVFRFITAHIELCLCTLHFIDQEPDAQILRSTEELVAANQVTV